MGVCAACYHGVGTGAHHIVALEVKPDLGVGDIGGADGRNISPQCRQRPNSHSIGQG